MLDAIELFSANGATPRPPPSEGNHERTALRRLRRNSGTVALTFDDSPDENTTFAVLDVLKRYGVKASFS